MITNQEELTNEFNEWVDEQSPERLKAAMERAKKRDLEFWDDESYYTIVFEEVKKMFVADVMEGLVKKDIVNLRVGSDGHFNYVLNTWAPPNVENV